MKKEAISHGVLDDLANRNDNWTKLDGVIDQVNELDENLKKASRVIGLDTARISNWKQVQDIVRSGQARDYFEIGDQFTATYNGKPYLWDVIGINHDKPSDPKFQYSLTIQAHDVIMNAQFDAPEPNNPDANIKVYGYNNYLKSNIRHFLNSDEASFKWVSQHEHDVASTSAPYNGAGFLNLLDQYLVSVLGKVDRVVARNTVTDGGGQDTYSDKVFLLTAKEVLALNEGTNTGEKPYEYYSMMSEAITNAAVDWRVKYLDKVARVWWLSSPNVGTSDYNRSVSTTGIVGNYASGTAGVAPVCVII